MANTVEEIPLPCSVGWWGAFILSRHPSSGQSIAGASIARVVYIALKSVIEEMNKSASPFNENGVPTRNGQGVCELAAVNRQSPDLLDVPARNAEITYQFSLRKAMHKHSFKTAISVGRISKFSVLIPD